MAEFKDKQKYVIYFLMFLIIHLIEKESGLRTELNSQFEYDMLVVFFTIFVCLSMIIIFLPTYILSRIVRKKIRKHVEDNRPKDHGWCIQSNPIGFFSKAYMWLPVVLIYNRVYTTYTYAHFMLLEKICFVNSRVFLSLSEY